MNARDFMRSWTSRGIIIVLVIAFAAWGIGDMLSQSATTSQDDVARVGEEGISGRRLQEDFQRDLSRLQARNPGLTAEDATRQGLHLQTLVRLVGMSLIQQEAKSLGIAVTDDRVREEIVTQPAFQNEAGEFDRKQYDRALSNSRMNADSYETAVRNDLSREQVLGAVLGERPAPRAFAEALYRARGETRNALSVIVPRDDATPIAEPDQATLEAFHKDNAERFTAPEYRTATVLRLTPEALVDTIELSDEDLKAEYDERAAEFNLPELRTIEQLQAPEEALIKEAATMLEQGQPFEALTTALTAKGASTNVLNGVAKDGLPADIATVVFELAVDKPSAPVKTAFGWSLFRVKEVAAPRTKTFDEVKEELRTEMSLRLAGDSVGRLSKTLEDELAGGANIEQAAKAVGVDTIKITTDRSGFDKANAEVLAEVAERGEILESVFALTSGGDSGLKETTGQTIFMAHVDSIEEAKLRPFADVRDKVLTVWQITERLKMAEAAANALAERVKAGTPLADAAKEKNYEVIALEGLPRVLEEERRGVTADVVRRLFAQSPHTPGAIVAPVPEGYAVVLLQSRDVPDPATAKDQIDQLADALGQGRANDLSIAYQAALERRYGVSINEQRLQSLFTTARN